MTENKIPVPIVLKQFSALTGWEYARFRMYESNFIIRNYVFYFNVHYSG